MDKTIRNCPLTRAATLALIFTFALLTPACSSPEQEKLAHVAKGQEYLKEKRFAEARLEFRSALKIDKKLPAAQFGLGEAGLALGYIQEAAEAYYEAMRLDPNNLDARVRVGSLLVQYESEEGVKEAERLANEVAQRNPDHVENRVLIADIRAAQKRWDDAQTEFQKAIGLDPNRIETYLHQARAFERHAKSDDAQAAKFHTQAEEIFRRLIEKNPASVSARLAFGDFLFADKRESEAEQQLLLAHKADAADKLVLVALRRYYETQQRYEEAEKYLTKLVELDPDKSAGRAQIIDLHARTGRVYQAVSEYQQLLKDDPKYLRGYSRVAELLLELGDLNAATKHVEAALKQSPQDTDALLMRGRLRTLNGQYREAVSDLDQVLRLEPSMPAALYYAADAHLQNNDATQARLFVNRLLSFYPRNPMGLLMQVRIHLNQGKAAEAEKTSTQIIESIAQLKSNATALRAARIPEDTLPEWESKAYISRAVARIQLRNYPEAQSDLERAGQLDKRSPEPHINLAAIHLLRGDLPNAQREAERALDLAPSNPTAATTAVNVYLQQKNYQAAHTRLNRLIAEQPTRLQLQELQARVFIAQGNKADAESTLREILKTDANYLNAYFLLSDFYQSSEQQTDRAIAELKQLISLRPTNAQQMAQAHLFIGMLEEGRGNVDEAVNNYEQMLSFDQRSIGAAIALNNLAWLYADKGKGNLDKATAHARSAITITPEANFFDTLGYAYYKKRQYEVAIEQFRKAIERKPDNAGYHLHLARALRDSGDTQRARQSYERALQLGGVNFGEGNLVKQELAALKRS
ncbi:MAG TPA: tetratricopeptide repeat protein [Blastocatellia bacterium]|nr:tetratricopeptide repeat protein [Blastocatellia bacterium]HMV87034.1 tetratricopeptide repeat protein [Blastocatellia bacterium]HMX26690.1 tetratricopeptide repeat protein [Blastocatellia bacterium]HMY71069.1 tetratricopeptide repeat protein [Blastocatellia bacterium]HMZ17683.1 tetratricopeptide repeat protein [Blastocatellia bacterium]